MKLHTYYTFLSSVVTMNIASGQITYVDAIADPVVGNVNTTATSGAELSTWYTTDGRNISSEFWNRRTGPFANPEGSGDVFQARNDGGSNFEELQTTITGLTEGQEYEFYVFFWDATSSQQAWTIEAGLESGNLEAFSAIGGPVAVDTTDGLASELIFAEQPVVTANGLVMHYANLGRVIADASGEVSIFVNNSISGEARRTWFDGVGFLPINDTDSDGMRDDFEQRIIDADPDDAITTIADVLPGDDFDSDNATNLQEFEFDSTTIDPDTERIPLDPTNPDTDGDSLPDGDELSGASNAFAAGTLTNPVAIDSDLDGLNDFEENGSLNTQFGNAATDPNNEDTDGDDMTDGYEVSNNNPGTALDPNDDGSTDATQAPRGDRDGDTLENFDEFDGFLAGVQTRADLIDTDNDGVNDNFEDAGEEFIFENGELMSAGTNPTNPDSDGDGLLDGEEQLNTPGASPNEAPYNSDPNLADTDGDGFSDFFEVRTGAVTDPNNPADAPEPITDYVLVEDFEGDGMVVGQTFLGVNDWVGGDPTLATVVQEPIAGGDQVGSWETGPTTGEIIYRRAFAKIGAEILEGDTGTLFFQVYTEAGVNNHSFGLSDLADPSSFNAFRPQLAFFGAENNIVPNDAGAGFRFPGGNHQVGRWMNVWIVANNDLDQMEVYIESPEGRTGQINIADTPAAPFAFRNGATQALRSFMLFQNIPNATPMLIDNIYVHPNVDAHLITPAPLKPVPTTGDNSLRVTNAIFNGDDFQVTFSPGGEGFIITSADDLAGAFTEVTSATYDGVSTFTIPAAALDPDGNDFFRVEAVAPAQ